jgi:hypothetical protein
MDPPSQVSSSRCLLHELPTEILLLICEYLYYQPVTIWNNGRPIPDPWSDLMQLSSTSKRLRPVARRILFRDITAGYTKERPDSRPHRVNLVNLVGTNSGPPLSLSTYRTLLTSQIRSLWENPELRTSVRHLGITYMHRHWHICSENAGEGKDYVYGDSGLLSRMIKEFLGVVPACAAQLCMGCWCRYSPQPLFLLLSLAPNLTSVEIHVRKGWRPDQLVRLLPDHSIQPIVTFPSLTRLVLVAHCGGRGWLWGFWDGFVNGILASTPNVEFLQFRWKGWSLHGVETWLPVLPRLTTLHLQKTTISCGNLLCIVRAAPNLKRFLLSSPSTLCTRYWVESMLPLLPTTLESLTLYLSYERDPSEHPVFPMDAFVSCLSHFSALKVLGTNQWWRPDGNIVRNLLRACPCLEGLVIHIEDTPTEGESNSWLGGAMMDCKAPLRRLRLMFVSEHLNDP